MARQRPFRDLALAVALLTYMPIPVDWPEDERPQVAAWFPLIGAFVGLAGYAFVKLAELSGVLARAPYAVASLLVVVWALVTRLLHWDGLADVADAYWGSHDQERRLEIMSDSHTGAFGATAVALVAVVEVASLGTFLVMHQSPVLLVPVFARFSASAAAWLGKPARPGGLGESVMGRPTVLSVVLAAAVLGGAGWAFYTGFGLLGVGFAVEGIALALVVPHLIAQRFGGVTGDVMGASVLITEALLLATIALVV